MNFAALMLSLCFVFGIYLLLCGPRINKVYNFEGKVLERVSLITKKMIDEQKEGWEKWEEYFHLYDSSRDDSTVWKPWRTIRSTFSEDFLKKIGL